MFKLIVTCVASKILRGPSISEALNNVIMTSVRDNVGQLFTEWKILLQRRLKPSALAEPMQLYSGGLWKEYVDAFEEIQGPREMWVISCGYGLIHYQQKISGYHVTFKAGEKDSLYDRQFFTWLKREVVYRTWWDMLTQNGILATSHPRSIHELVNTSTPNDAVLIVAGKEYYGAIMNDLSKISISQDGLELALLGIKEENGQYVPTVTKNLESFVRPYKDVEELRKLFGGNKIQVHAKSARFLIREYNRTGKFTHL